MGQLVLTSEPSQVISTILTFVINHFMRVISLAELSSLVHIWYFMVSIENIIAATSLFPMNLYSNGCQPYQRYTPNHLSISQDLVRLMLSMNEWNFIHSITVCTNSIQNLNRRLPRIWILYISYGWPLVIVLRLAFIFLRTFALTIV